MHTGHQYSVWVVDIHLQLALWVDYLPFLMAGYPIFEFQELYLIRYYRFI